MKTEQKSSKAARATYAAANQEPAHPGDRPGAPTRLIPLTKWNDYHPWPGRGGLRHLVFYEETNGFSKVVVRIGRRVLLDERAFFEWAREQNTPDGGRGQR